ncbi:antibiotic biosynthesis monooxygenase [Mesorhizobium sp. Z1-4]|uniref:putative quinol monooxygenase n=1 Tax=Mesorhizobium sp. Z1-4 TaxID=2448478 RepID=UPI0013DEC734|nr:antibiotic biosynthesis monooxygenase [Mesorhizobium sp. Z1-4]
MERIDLTEQVVLIIEYEVAEENRARFMQLMAESCEDTIRDEGCMRMELCQPQSGEDGVYFLTELWRDQSCIEKHRLKPGHSKVHEDIDALLAKKRVSKLNTFAVNGWTQIPAAMAKA